MEPVRWGVLSTADIGMEKVLPAVMAAEGCELVAIASRDPARAEAAAARLGIPEAVGSYEELLAHPQVEAVYIPLPNHLHAEWTTAAAAAGKHVLCEKPLALSAAQAQEMVDACAAAGVVLMEAFMYRFHPSWVRARELVDGGRIGELVAVQSWFSYFNRDPANIRNILEYGGGALMDIGCYNVNLSRMLFGAEPDSIHSVVRRDPDFGTDVVASSVLGFPGGGQSTFTCSTQAEPGQWVAIVGSAGRIDIEIPFNIPPDRPTRIRVTVDGAEPETISFEPADQYGIEASLFAQAVRAGGPAPLPPEDAVANMRVIEAILASG